IGFERLVDQGELATAMRQRVAMESIAHLFIPTGSFWLVFLMAWRAMAGRVSLDPRRRSASARPTNRNPRGVSGVPDARLPSSGRRVGVNGRPAGEDQSPVKRGSRPSRNDATPSRKSA